MSDQEEIDKLTHAGTGMKRSLRVPSFITLLVLSICGVIFLVFRGYAWFDWHVLVAASAALISIIVLSTGYTGRRGL